MYDRDGDSGVSEKAKRTSVSLILSMCRGVMSPNSLKKWRHYLTTLSISLTTERVWVISPTTPSDPSAGSFGLKHNALICNTLSSAIRVFPNENALVTSK